MSFSAIGISQSLRTEADRILAAGLRALLEGYGDTVIHGSYALDLMVWRDLDIYVSPPAMALGEFFGLGAQIAELLSPNRMHFRDERGIPSEGLPRGLYWGVYLRERPWGAWKIDIWTVSREESQRLLAQEDNLSRRLTAEIRPAIVAIKFAVCHHPEYRKRFSAADIYGAVLDHGVRDLAEFKVWLKRYANMRIEP